jgi:hypothetical protein
VDVHRVRSRLENGRRARHVQHALLFDNPRRCNAIACFARATKQPSYVAKARRRV